MASQLNMLGLAADIVTCTREITGQLQKSGFTEPTFDVASSRELWESPNLDLKAAKTKLVEASSTLLTLVNGPMAFHRNWFGSHYDLVAFQAMLEFKVLDNIPATGSIDLHTLAAKVQLDQDKLRRILRLLGTHRYINEPERDCFEHTVLSEILLRDELLKAQGGLQYISHQTSWCFLAHSLQVERHAQGQRSSFGILKGETLL